MYNKVNLQLIQPLTIDSVKVCTTPPGLTLNSTVFVESGEASTRTNAAIDTSASRDAKCAAQKLFLVAIASSLMCVQWVAPQVIRYPVDCECRHIMRHIPNQKHQTKSDKTPKNINIKKEEYHGCVVVQNILLADELHRSTALTTEG